MSTAIVRGASPELPVALLPQSFAEMVDLSERLAKSALLPSALRNKPSDVLLQVMTGRELGLGPMASLSAFYVLDGKVSMAADTMVALVLRSGACRYFRPLKGASEKSVTYVTRRGNDDEVSCTWTIEMARTASLHMRDNWRAYPRAMLAARAKAELARSIYPDVLAGIYTPDELGATEVLEPFATYEEAADESTVAEQPTSDERREPPTADAPVPETDYPELAQIDKATSIAQLKTIGSALTARGLSDEQREVAHDRYRARLDYLRQQGAKPAEAS